MHRIRFTNFNKKSRKSDFSGFLSLRHMRRPKRPEKRAEKRRHQVFMAKLDDASATRSLPLTTIAKPMNRFAACGDPRAERGLRIER